MKSIETADNGDEAVEKIMSGNWFNVILMDL